MIWFDFGDLADVIGIRTVFAIGGGITLLAALFAWTLFRRAPSADAVAPSGIPDSAAAAGTSATA